ncbi:hypothetical protein CRG98_001740 [Punica granatum]|uniref:Glycosyltransferase n=1 Tax=Punica granatum TaxID=22663 RepID=A0A2I0LAY9_PUNGR|nr:hypothetical protein CRG98_001740 [Punica granatum]
MRLLRSGSCVTFATSRSALRQMRESKETFDDLSYAAFSDGYDDGFDIGKHDIQQFMDELKRQGPQTLGELIGNCLTEGREFTHVFYTTLIPWAADVASSFRLRSTLIWTQPATVLDIYYYYFDGYGDVISDAGINSSSPIVLPGLPPLTGRDVPSFFSPENHYSYFLPLMKRQFEILDEQGNSHKVLVNTFDALEEGPLRATRKLNLVGIGPLLPSAFLDGHNPSDTSFGGDIFQGSSKNYTEWLNNNPRASVIYICFGSIHLLTRRQRDELARGLLSSSRPFLWVMFDDPYLKFFNSLIMFRAQYNVMRDAGKNDEENGQLIYQEELERQGIIIPWSTQVEVLSHPLEGCFVTHCGWNSTSESLACGVPMVACPQWVDQRTDAKLVEDMWKTGVRANLKSGTIIEGEEIRRCLDLVMGEGEKGEEIRRNARKWKELAKEAAGEGGSSDKNLRAFLEEIASSV